MKTVLITGANQGLGYELALGLKEDFDLILVSKSDHQMSNIKSSNHVYIKKVDLMLKEQVENLCEHLIQDYMIPDIIVHNAGGSWREDIHSLNIEVIDKSMRLNFSSAVQINSTLMDEFLKKKSVKLFHISTDATITGNARPGYVSAKSALNGYIQSSARYYAKYGIYFIGLLPGIFEHPNNSWGKCKVQNPSTYKEQLNNHPFDVFFSAKDMANAIIPLIKSEHIQPFNGSLIKLNGGC